MLRLVDAPARGHDSPKPSIYVRGGFTYFLARTYAPTPHAAQTSSSAR